MEQQSGSIVSSEIDGELIYFFVREPQDTIQHYHANGAFYEYQELKLVGQFFPRRGVFVDIGANVGNHAIFALKYLKASQALLFEPNPAAIEILRINLLLNQVKPQVELFPLGLGRAPGLAKVTPSPGNLGAARLLPTVTNQGVRVLPGDEALRGRRVDFIKLDVEGMELEVLEGLKQTFQRCRPNALVEVDNANRPGFDAWLAANDYVIRATAKRYQENENFLVTPAKPRR